MSWLIELFEYMLAFESQNMIKAQVLADFIIKLVRKELGVSNGDKRPD